MSRGIASATPAKRASPETESVAIAVLDRDINYFKTADAAVVDDRVAAREWELVRSALVRKTSLQQVSSFSASMAQTRSANAWAAIILSLLGILAYIWIRFGSLRYSAAAIIALLHDVTLTLGALAVTGYLAGNAFFSQTMMIGEFRIDLGVVAALQTDIRARAERAGAADGRPDFREAFRFFNPGGKAEGPLQQPCQRALRLAARHPQLVPRHL